MSSNEAHHDVSFFDRDDDLSRALADFVGEGLQRRERVLVLATRDHWDRAWTLLAAQDVGTASAVERGDLQFIDARDVIGQIMVDGRVEPARFRALVGSQLADVPGPVRVFSEVVSCLAAVGQMEAALEIEAMGHELSHAGGIPVLCAYDLRILGQSSDALQRIAARHDRVRTVERTDPGPLVLLADDFEDTRELYRDFLQLQGYRVVTASDGHEAVERARACKPDIILLDIRMPNMTGTEAMRMLKQDAGLARTPMLALTAHALPAERERFLALGFDAVLPKPCLPEQLQAAIEGRIGPARTAAMP